MEISSPPFSIEAVGLGKNSRSFFIHGLIYQAIAGSGSSQLVLWASIPLPKYYGLLGLFLGASMVTYLIIIGVRARIRYHLCSILVPSDGSTEYHQQLGALLGAKMYLR